MPRAPRRERRLAKLQCDNCGHRYEQVEWGKAHYVESGTVLAKWVLERTDLVCPNCHKQAVRQRD